MDCKHQDSCECEDWDAIYSSVPSSSFVKLSSEAHEVPTRAGMTSEASALFVQKARPDYYVGFLTYKRLGNSEIVNFSHYDFIKQLLHNLDCDVHFKTYEHDHIGRLHTHLIISYPSKLFRKKLSRRGYHMNLKRLLTKEDCQRALIYMHKELFELLYPRIVYNAVETPSKTKPIEATNS